MKKTILVVLCVLTAASLFAGGGQQSSKTIAYFMPHLNNEWATDLDAALKAEITKVGYTPLQFVCDNDPQKQISQIDQAINRKVAGIILDPIDPEALGPSVDKAMKAGIPVVCCHEYVTKDKYHPVSQIIPNFTDGGKTKMAECMKDLPNGGNIAFMYGPQGHPAQIAIAAGYPIALKGQESKYPVVFTAYGDWSDASALSTTEAWLSSGTKIDAIVSDNDGMAFGIIQAIKAAGKTGQIKLYGLDGTQRSFQAIKAGELTATIATDVPAEAGRSVEQIMKAINKQPTEAWIDLAMPIVNMGNVDKYLK
jgi:ABC-type sugar transport system substrate-binding protein